MAQNTQVTKTVRDESKCARASSLNLPVSSRQSTEIGRYLRFHSVTFATRFLEDVIAMRKPVPYRRHVFDLGHKPGIGPGRFPQKAAREFLRVIKNAEKNAQFKGLNTQSLKIVKLISNKASIPPMAGRHRHAGRRTHIEVEVMEMKTSAGSSKVNIAAKGSSAGSKKSTSSSASSTSSSKKSASSEGAQ